MQHKPLKKIRLPHCSQNGCRPPVAVTTNEQMSRICPEGICKTTRCDQRLCYTDQLHSAGLHPQLATGQAEWSRILRISSRSGTILVFHGYHDDTIACDLPEKVRSHVHVAPLPVGVHKSRVACRRRFRTKRRRIEHATRPSRAKMLQQEAREKHKARHGIGGTFALRQILCLFAPSLCGFGGVEGAAPKPIKDIHSRSHHLESAAQPRLLRLSYHRHLRPAIEGGEGCQCSPSQLCAAQRRILHQ
mmetsp:Transcript_82745/g.183847  ORF Transcript_82745/g.183847 Transcript_82745/m.183847 type:complete len:246 (+) Transcript_82745:3-740(+)